jgi:tRNA A-37 threonylcarbamoyl transferase component Bud32
MTRPVTTPGRLVAGRYRLQSQLGGGGMGTVWLARDELLGRQVAIKQVLTPVGISAEEADQQRQRALREGRIAARLSHPHAISVYDVALESGQPWLVMEYLPSRSLAAVLTEDGVLRSDQVAQIGAQVADALAATHAAGIVHRDVKPANILIGEGGRVEGLVKITDFGISHASGDVTLTQTGQITGTPAFLAPEVAQGQPMTEASDVFSLGATLYTCLEGTPPFGMEDNALGMLHRVAGGQVVPPRRSQYLTEPLQRILAADPADRPTMAQVRDELATLAAGRDGDTTTILLARTDLGSAAPGRTRTTRFPAGAAAADGAAGAAGAAGALAAAGAAEPAGAAAATATPAPPAAPPPSAPAPPPPVERSAGGPAPADGPRPAGERPPREPGRRRSGAFRVAAALVVLVLAGLLTFWLVDPFGDDGSNVQATPAATSSSTTEPTTEATTEATQTTAAPTPESTAVSAAGTPDDSPPAGGGDVDKAVKNFFADVPGDLEEAYARTSPGFQDRFPYEGFAGFWGDFEDVKVGNIRAEDGSTAATVDITYIWPDGERQTEQHLVTFVAGDDGTLLLDTDEGQGVVG